MDGACDDKFGVKKLSYNVSAVNEGFLCPMRKMRSILRAQKTLAERKLHKGR